MRIERRCSCGMVLKVTIAPRERDKVLGNWYAVHCGAGHTDADPASRGGALRDRAAQRLAEEQRWALFYEYDGS